MVTVLASSETQMLMKVNDHSIYLSIYLSIYIYMNIVKQQELAVRKTNMNLSPSDKLGESIRTH